MCHACMYSKLLIALTIRLFSIRFSLIFYLVVGGLQAQIEGSDWRVPHRVKFNHANNI